MKTDSMPSNGKAATIRANFMLLVGLRLFKAWNVFATRIFYFTSPRSEARGRDEEFALQLECPWRIERLDQIIVGSEDYGARASNNSDEAWEPNMQWGQLQDEKLKDLLGKEENGAIFSARSDLIVGSVEVDDVGGFRLQLSGGYTLAAFPTTDGEMEWLLKQPSGRYLILCKGNLQAG